jgi:hypothetical protein
MKTLIIGIFAITIIAYVANKIIKTKMKDWL